MASYTTNLNLKKPAGSENVAIGDINNNMDTIDQAYGTLSSNLNKLLGNNMQWTANVDADTLTETGIYMLSTGGSNLPTGVSWCSIITIAPRSDTKWQILLSLRNVYCRSYGGSPTAWQTWSTIL